MASGRERRPDSMSGSGGVSKVGGEESPPSRIWIAVGLIALGVAAADLLACGERTTSKPVPPDAPGVTSPSPSSSMENRAPVLLDAHLVPEKPDARSRIALVAESRDPEGDPIRYEVTWFRNGARVQAPSLQVFPDGVARRGDRIYAEVVATDGVHKTPSSRTREVTVQNLPPAATEVKIAPVPLAVGQPATATASGGDPDGDVIRWRYKWILNGQAAVDAEGPVFPGERIHRNDRLRVTATPYDTSGSGTPVESAEAAVGNRPPRIVSTPPQVPKDLTLSYAVRAEDPDGDPVSLKLEGNVPQGFVLSPAGLLTADLQHVQPGQYEIHIVATDTQGESDTQVFTLTVTGQPVAAPPARPHAPGTS